MRLKSSETSIKSLLFQLTHPTRGATYIRIYDKKLERISTHTPHTGCDESVFDCSCTHSYFNSHTPHGVRPPEILLNGTATKISTHTPHTGCDGIKSPIRTALAISTHTPHTGCDIGSLKFTRHNRNFNSHTPHGVRPGWKTEEMLGGLISTHTPHTGCDIIYQVGCTVVCGFQLTHPTRGATHAQY